MKRHLIHTSVQCAEGSQTWYVDATTEEEAIAKYNNGDADIYANDVDVTSLGDPEIGGETTLDDFGDFGPSPQRTWVGLTDDEADKIYKDGSTFGEMMRMVEAKLKEKNT